MVLPVPVGVGIAWPVGVGISVGFADFTGSVRFAGSICFTGFYLLFLLAPVVLLGLLALP
jgi:hypothetical protein